MEPPATPSPSNNSSDSLPGSASALSSRVRESLVVPPGSTTPSLTSLLRTAQAHLTKALNLAERTPGADLVVAINSSIVDLQLALDYVSPSSDPSSAPTLPNSLASLPDARKEVASDLLVPHPPSSGSDVRNHSSSSSLSSGSNKTARNSLYTIADVRTNPRLVPLDGDSKRYKKVRKLGEGGQGQVWEVFQPYLNQSFAMKCVSLGGDPEKYYEEARSLFSLNHENIVRLYDCTVDQERAEQPQLAIVMELLGDTLQRFIDRNSFTLQDVVRVVSGILSGLHELHKYRYVHRDLKPSNVCVKTCDGRDVVKILDLGLAMKEEALREEKNLRHLAAGTPDWLSPEQQSRGTLAPITRLSDIWAAGKILATMLTHKSLSIHTEDEPTKDKLLDCAKKAMLEDPYNRFKSADKFLRRIAGTALYSADGKLQPFVKPSWFNYPFVFESCVGGFRPELLTIRLDRDFRGYDVPADMSVAYATAIAKTKANPNVWNGNCVAVRKAYRSRTPTHEEHVLTLDCYMTTYFHNRAMRSLFDNVISAERRKEMLDSLALWRYPEYCTSLGTHITIITSDKKILFCHRSKDFVAQSNDTITCGAVEGLSDKDVSGDQVDIYAASARALKEELAYLVSRPRAEIKITAFMCKREQHEWGFVGYCRSTQPSHVVKAAWRAAPVADGWEHEKLEFVDFNVSAVGAFIREQKGRVIASAVACALHALQSEYKEDDVATSLMRLLCS